MLYRHGRHELHDTFAVPPAIPTILLNRTMELFGHAPHGRHVCMTLYTANNPLFCIFAHNLTSA
jgi:hypothetical protein